ncbi:MAG: hypothetical protein HY726_12535 [Candidatus Rokubacteria bacterium]|nr:hypothetical protein [Candidatus Rokubacteria bacterium]
MAKRRSVQKEIPAILRQWMQVLSSYAPEAVAEELLKKYRELYPDLQINEPTLRDAVREELSLRRSRQTASKLRRQPS